MAATKVATPPHRHTASLQKTKIIINCYDLLPPGNFTSALWNCGLSLLHSGVAIGSKEYAYGGHDRPHLTGIYWTSPAQAPPGSVHRAEIHHGFTILTDGEIQAVVHEASKKFLGTDWNLLSRNCNHFTNYLCEELTGMPAPSWLNRAAAVGVRLPCLLPREFVRAPGAEEAALETVDEEEDSDEEVHLLGRSRSRESYLVQSDQEESSSEEEETTGQRRNDDAEYTSDESEEPEVRRKHRGGRNRGTYLAPPATPAKQKSKKRRTVEPTGRVLPLRRRDRLKTRARSRAYHHLRSPHPCRWYDILLFTRHRDDPEIIDGLRQRWERILSKKEETKEAGTTLPMAFAGEACEGNK